MDPYALLASKVIDLFITGMNREAVIAEVNKQRAAGATVEQINENLDALIAQRRMEALDAIAKAKAEGR